MILPLSYHRLFWTEARYYHDWYEARGTGLGRAFFQAIEIGLDEIATHPERYALATATIRQCPVARFPFTIDYRITPDKIRILAVWHNARGSSDWKRRR